MMVAKVTETFVPPITFTQSEMLLVIGASLGVGILIGLIVLLLTGD